MADCLSARAGSSPALRGACRASTVSTASRCGSPRARFEEGRRTSSLRACDRPSSRTRAGSIRTRTSRDLAASLPAAVYPPVWSLFTGSKETIEFAAAHVTSPGSSRRSLMG